MYGRMQEDFGYGGIENLDRPLNQPQSRRSWMRTAINSRSRNEDKKDTQRK